MSKFTPTEVVVTRSQAIQTEEDVQHFFQEGWPYEVRTGIFIKVGRGKSIGLSKMLNDRIVPFGSEVDPDGYDLGYLENIEELFWDSAIGLSVKGSVTALLILHTLF